MGELIEEHLLWFQQEGATENSIQARRRCLRRLHDDLPRGLLGATTEELREWINYDRWKPATKQTNRNHMVGMFRWLVAVGYRMHDPSAGVQRIHVPIGIPHPATDGQVRIMCTEPPEFIRIASTLAAYGGFRRAEAAAAKREHFTETVSYIPVAKGGKPQTVPTHPLIWQLVRDRPDGYLCLHDGDPLTAPRLGDYVRLWCLRRQGWRLSMHSLRHWFGTTIQRRHGDLRLTQECLRHARVSTTQIYTMITDSQREAAVATLPVLGVEPVSTRLGSQAG